MGALGAFSSLGRGVFFGFGAAPGQPRSQKDPSFISYAHGSHKLWLHFGVDEHSFATYFDVQGYRVLTHSRIPFGNCPRGENLWIG